MIGNTTLPSAPGDESSHGGWVRGVSLGHGSETSFQKRTHTHSILALVFPAYLGLDVATWVPCFAIVSEAVVERLVTNDPSRSDGIVDRPTRAGGAVKAWLPTTAQSAKRKVYSIDRMIQSDKSFYVYKSVFAIHTVSDRRCLRLLLLLAGDPTCKLCSGLFSFFKLAKHDYVVTTVSQAIAQCSLPPLQ